MHEASDTIFTKPVPSATELMHARRRRQNKTRNGFLLLVAAVLTVTSAAVWGGTIPSLVLGAPWSECRNGVALGYLFGGLGGFVGLALFARLASDISLPRSGDFIPVDSTSRESQRFDFLAGTQAMILLVLLATTLGAIAGTCLAEPPVPAGNGAAISPLKAVGAIGGTLLTLPLIWIVYRWWKQSG